MKNLSLTDVLGLLVCWAGIGATLYFSVQHAAYFFVAFVALVCVCAGYYLSKWIILKHDPENPS